MYVMNIEKAFGAAVCEDKLEDVCRLTYKIELISKKLINSMLASTEREEAREGV